MDELLPRGSLKEIDPLVNDMIRFEAERQHRKLIMIASESICPPSVREALSSELGHLYAEGYPSPRTRYEPPARLWSFPYQLAMYRRLSNRRYYKGCEYADILEQTVRRRTAEVFATPDEPPENLFVNAQPLSGAAANNAVYNALVKPGDVVLGPSLTHGGHLTHGSEVNRSGRIHKIVSYEIARSGKLDYDTVQALAREHKPKMIIGGFSAYPWDIDWPRMRQIAEEVGAYLLADIAHLAGMVAAGLLRNPVGHAHAVSFTTHKTLCGPRGAMIISTDPDIAARIDLGVFPGEQGGPHIHVLAAKAVAMAIAKTEGFKKLQQGVLENAQALAQGFVEQGLSLAYGGTNTHLCLLDLRKLKTPTGELLSGEVASRFLDLCGIVCNKNTIFGDTVATHPSGVRFGTTWVTQRGLGPAHMKRIAGIVSRVLHNVHPFGYMGQRINLGRGKKNIDLLTEMTREVAAIVAEAKPEPTWDPAAPPSGYPHFAPPTAPVVQRTPLHALHRSQAVPLVERDGFQVPARYNVPDRERLALREGAALVDTGDGLLLEIGQGKAGQFLECVCSTGILRLQPGSCEASLILDPAGEPMARTLAIRLPTDEHAADRFLLKVSAKEPDHVLRWLRSLSDGYAMHDEDLYLKCEGPAVIEDLARPSRGREPWTSLGLRGPRASEAAERAFGRAPAPGHVLEVDGLLLVGRPEGMTPGFEVLMPVSGAPALWSRLVEAGAQPTGVEALAEILPEDAERRRFEERVDLSKPFFIGQKMRLRTQPAPERPRSFSFAPTAGPLRETNLFPEHERRCSPKHIVPFAGYKMPVMYSGILDEHEAVRSRAGLFDVSHMGLLDFQGPYAERFLDLVTTNYVPLLQPGQAHYSYLLAPDGRCIDDVIVYRVARERFLVVVNAANAEEDEAWLRAVAAGEVLVDEANPRARLTGPMTIRNLKDPASGDDARVDIALQGPLSPKVLRRLAEGRPFQTAIERLRKFELASGRLAGLDVTVARTGYTGEEHGFEIFVHPARVRELWNTILDAGSGADADGKPVVLPAGLGARDSLRTEAGYPLHGHELAGPHRITPIEAGYGSYVRLHKPFFVGRAAMLQGHLKRERAIVRFAVEEKGGKVLRAGNPVLADRKGEYAGFVTSATSTGKRQVGLALVDTKLARPGATFHVLPITTGDKAPPARSPLELRPGDWMTLPRPAMVVDRFMKPGEK